jgi:DNA helicase-2/ATP-dependent DNA helicase PcrA
LPHQRSLDDQGRAGLEEERRLAHVGITRARKNARIYFVSNRRIHGSWSSTMPSRFVDELPEAHVEVGESQGGFGGYGGYGRSRFDTMESFGSNYSTPGWQRAQARMNRDEFDEGEPYYRAEAEAAPTPRGATSSTGQTTRGRGDARASRPVHREPLTIEGELVAKSTGPSTHAVGERVFHQKFGNGEVVLVDGNKLTILFDKAGEKRVVDSFVERV